MSNYCNCFVIKITLPQRVQIMAGTEPLNGVKEFACLSVTKFDPNYLRTGERGGCMHACKPFLFCLKEGAKV